jgi:hypothetical protein
MSYNKTCVIKGYTILLKWSDTMWYSKSKTGLTRQYHWFDIGYLVYKEGRQVGVKLCIGKFLFFVGWEKSKKLSKRV